MRRPVTKHPHKVPQLLLRGFSDPKKRIWGWDKTTGQVFANTYEEVEKERHFYIWPEVEEVLGRIESDAAPVIHRIRQDRSVGSLIPDERRCIRRFVAAQFARTGARREAILDRNRQEEVRLREIAESLQVSLDEIEVDGWTRMEKAHVARLSVVGVLKLIQDAPRLLEKYIPVLFAPADENAKLVIGDNPVARISTRQLPVGLGPRLDLGAPGLELYLPISSSLVLGLVDEDRLLDPAVEYARLMRQRGRGRTFRASEWLWIEQAERFMEVTMAGGIVPLGTGEVRTHLALQKEGALRFVYAGDRETLDAMAAS